MVKGVEVLIKQGLGEDVFYLDSRFRKVDVKFLGETFMLRESPDCPLDFGNYSKNLACIVTKTRRNNDGALVYTVDYFRILRRHRF